MLQCDAQQSLWSSQATPICTTAPLTTPSSEELQLNELRRKNYRDALVQKLRVRMAEKISQRIMMRTEISPRKAAFSRFVCLLKLPNRIAQLPT